MFGRLFAVAALLAGCAAPAAQEPDATTQQGAWAAQCSDDSGWDDPGPPFKVYGNTYYVGTCGIAAILVTGDKGDVLIDSGTEKGAAVVEANIRALGFDPANVKVLLMTHEHHDHVGGMARLQHVTGAKLLASPRAARAMASGKASEDDPQFAIDGGFAPVRVDGDVRDGVPVTLGHLSLTPVATPGHTPGATSWQWRSCEGTACRTIVYADSLSPVSSDSYKFSEHAAYLADFRRSLARLAQLDCDILLSPHPAASAMDERLAKDALVDPTACKAYAADRTRQLDARLAKEAGGQ